MFREMRRIRQQTDTAECERILEAAKRGVLSVNGDGGYPYGMPMDHWYCPEDGKIYFHSGMQGHKVDSFRADDRASYCVFDEGYRKPGEWALNIRSVIVFGRIEIVEEPERALMAVRQLSLRFTKDTAEIEEEIRRSGAHTLYFALVPEYMTGKLVNES